MFPAIKSLWIFNTILAACLSSPERTSSRIAFRNSCGFTRRHRSQPRGNDFALRRHGSHALASASDRGSASDEGSPNGFITKLNPTGSALLHSTFFGGSSDDYGCGLATDGLGNVYVTGESFSKNFPVTTGAYQTPNHANSNGGTNVFVAKLSLGNGGSMAPPVLTSPTPGSTLTSSSAMFIWTAAGSGNQGYWLFLGTEGVGSKNLHDSGQQTATSATFSNLPTDGATIYARVYTRYNGVLVYNDYTYKAAQ